MSDWTVCPPSLSPCAYIVDHTSLECRCCDWPVNSTGPMTWQEGRYEFGCEEGLVAKTALYLVAL